ncbi:MAG: HNH endonuclease [Acidithiobacillus sp.]
MNKEDAETLSELLASVKTASQPKYSLIEHIDAEELVGFHPFADARKCVGAYLFEDHEANDNRLWVLLLDWRKNGNFYIVLFPGAQFGPVVEIHRLTVNNGEKVLHWRYSPSKRDGRNEERKAYFVDAFLSENVQISVPNNPDEVDDFIEELFSLVSSRTKADELDPSRPSVRSGFPEGKLKERLHLSRERNRELVLKAKLLAQNRDGCLKCACCGFDFFATYGEVGKGFIEAHHTKPVSTLHENGEETKIEDIALVCSNCHRMLHRKRPWLKMNELSSLLVTDRF